MNIEDIAKKCAKKAKVFWLQMKAQVQLQKDLKLSIENTEVNRVSFRETLFSSQG